MKLPNWLKRAFIASGNPPESPVAAITPVTPKTRLTEIFETVEGSTLTKFTFSDLCRMQLELKAEMLLRANLLNSRMEGNTVHAFKPEFFRQEMKALATINKAMRFSDALQDWVTENLTRLGYSLARQQNYMALKRLWNGMDENGRLSVLRSISLMQNTAFNTGTLQFRPARLEFRKMQDGSLGSFQFDGDALDPDAVPLITMDKDLLLEAGLDKALIAIVHENLHNLMRQLATLRHTGMLSDKNPLYADAGIMIDIIRKNTYTPTVYGLEPYLADPKERICHDAHKGFIPLYSEQVALRENRIDRIARRPDVP